MGNQFKDVAVITCLKTFLFIFNLIFWVSGIILLVAGIWAEYDLYKHMELSSEFTGTVPHVMVAIAACMILLSSVAFSCIIKGNPVMLYVYGGFLCCILVMDAGFGVSVVCNKANFEKDLYDGLTHRVITYDPHKNNFDLAQSTLQCCGVSNYTDWVRLSPQRVIPMSCCVDFSQCITANYSDVFQRGCHAAVMEYLKGNISAILAVAVVSALFPILGTVLACCLANYIKKFKYNAIN